MKNHFYITYFGNKREEVEKIYDFIKSYIDDYDIIVEPYCGSQSISYYIALQTKGKKYILNDNNKYLKEIFEIMKDDAKIEEFNNIVNNKFFNELQGNKEEYVKYTKEDNVYAWFIANKFFKLRPGNFVNDDRGFKKVNLKEVSIYNFYKNNDIEFYTNDALEIYNKYKTNKKALIILDPPYLSASNDFYIDSNTNIYEYLYNNNIQLELAKVVLILENTWIIKLLFQNNIKYEYDKTYAVTNKKKTKHVVISN